MILAGGINLQNVGEILTQIQPFGIDLSSSLEKNGQKDSHLIQIFFNEIQNTKLKINRKNKEVNVL
jgi:phosphoribosylanthranilate isomerase